MAIEIQTARQPLSPNDSDSPAGASNLMSYADQGLFLTLRSMDQESIIQAAWIYEHPLDEAGLRRFHQNFGYGIAGRSIERSPLPFGRHRWVATPGAPMDIEFCSPRERSELMSWLDERAQLPVDPEWGPGWRIGVLPMTDGSTAVTLTGSHALGDGIAASIRVFQAVLGMRTDLGYPPPKSRTRRRAVLADLRQTYRDLPDTLRAFAALVRFLYGEWRKSRRTARALPARPPTPALPAISANELQRNVVLPAVFLTIDVAQWDATARRLGANGHSLLAGFGARVAQRIGRLGDDGDVTLLIPISQRDSLDDGRANAVVMATAKVDPAGIEHDLSGARSAMREAVNKARSEPDRLAEVMALVPWLPRRAMRGMADATFGFTADRPVFCSNVGDMPAEIMRADGTDAEYMFIRGIDRRVTREALERRSGLLTVMSARAGSTVIMSVVGYEPGHPNTRDWLRDIVDATLADFGLTGHIE